MQGIKRLVGLGVVAILLLTILTNVAMAASSKTSEKKDVKTGWKLDKQDVHKGKNIKLPQKNMKIQQHDKKNLPFEKNTNTNGVKKARPEKLDSIN